MSKEKTWWAIKKSNGSYLCYDKMGPILHTDPGYCEPHKKDGDKIVRVKIVEVE